MTEIRMAIASAFGFLPHESAFTHVDEDGDRLLISSAVMNDGGPGIYFRSDIRGSGLPLSELPRLIEQLSVMAEVARQEAGES